MLLSLDPDDENVKEKQQRKKTYAPWVAVTLVCVAIPAAHFWWDAASQQKPAIRTSESTPDSDKQAGKVPQELNLAADLRLPASRLPKQAGRAYRPTSPPPESIVGISATAPESPRGGDRVSRPDAVSAKPAVSASRVEFETPRHRADATQQQPQDTERQSSWITPLPASPFQEVNSTQLAYTNEIIAQLTTLIGKSEFATAVDSAIMFLDKHPELPETHGSEYRELLKLQRTATEKYFRSQALSGRRPAYDTGDLDVAVIDHDLMTAYLQAASPSLAREHFLKAEKGYSRALAIARQQDRRASGGSSAKREIQQITENLGLLYASWTVYMPDTSILRKADAAFYDSERLLGYAEDPVSAKERVAGGKASVERVRRQLQ